VTQKFLHLVDGHEARVEQNRGNRVAQQMRVDALGDARLLGEAFDHGPYRAHRVDGLTVALKKLSY
jgi:hypothetical protein